MDSPERFKKPMENYEIPAQLSLCPLPGRLDHSQNARLDGLGNCREDLIIEIGPLGVLVLRNKPAVTYFWVVWHC